MAGRITVLKRALSTSTAMSGAIKQVTIVGGGLMGSGIAQVAAQTGHDVTLVDINDAAIQKAKSGIENSLQRVAKKQFKDNPSSGAEFINSTLRRLTLTTDLKASVKSADLVVEAIVENLEKKHEMLKIIDPVAPQHTIFASNTSSLSIGDIASVTNRKDRFGGLHFFNPVPVMKLLEVIRIPETSEDTYQKMMEWGKAIGKTTITCKDSPGFVVNRLLIPYSAEAFRLVERGDATYQDVDIAMKLGAGYPMGPFELADYTGLDTNLFIIEGWHKKFPDDPMFKPSSLLKKMVAEGKLGVKSGEGFYKYNKK